MSSTEKEIKDQIRIEYKDTYPNVIFALTENLMRKDEEIAELKKLIPKSKYEKEKNS